MTNSNIKKREQSLAANQFKKSHSIPPVFGKSDPSEQKKKHS
jgi:hypothetical protein